MDPHLQRAQDALQRCAGGLTLAQLTARPSGKWTIAEILEHLARAFSGTAAGADRAIAGERPSARPSGISDRLRAFVVIDCGYLPTGRLSPKAAIPVGIDPETALTAACENLRRMDEALRQAAARFGVGVKLMDHPILGPLSVRQWRRFHWVHTRHHVRQIVARTAKGASA